MPGPTKAIKKTDQKQQKAWLKKKQPTGYRLNTRDTNKTILIVCEGQSEKFYFESFPVITLSVEAFDTGGISKLQLVHETKRINKEKKYDFIWCVFDMDVKQGEKEFSDFDTAIDSAISLGYNVAYSNDCYELWYYLHYDYTDSRNHRTFYYKKLSELWNMNYVNDGKKYGFCKMAYKKLNDDPKASQDRAIKSADKIHLNQKDLPYHRQNPVTTIHKLVVFLNKNSK